MKHKLEPSAVDESHLLWLDANRQWHPQDSPNSDNKGSCHSKENRTPKADLTAQMAEALDVSPRAIAVPDIDSMDGLMHTLFALEDRKLIRIQNVDGLVCLRAEIAEGGTKAAELNSRLMSWEDEKGKLKAGKITKEEYDRWRYHYPDYDDSMIRVKIPPDIPMPKKRGRKPKKA